MLETPGGQGPRRPHARGGRTRARCASAASSPAARRAQPRAQSRPRAPRRRTLERRRRWRPRQRAERLLELGPQRRACGCTRIGLAEAHGGGVPALGVDLEHHLGGPGDSSSACLSSVDLAPAGERRDRRRCSGLAPAASAARGGRRPAPAPGRSPPRSGANGSTDCTTRQVLPASLWSTRPRTSTTWSTAQRLPRARPAPCRTRAARRSPRGRRAWRTSSVAVAGADPLGLGDDPADRDPVLVAALGERGQRAVDARPQRLAQGLERMGGDEQPDRFLLGRQQLRPGRTPPAGIGGCTGRREPEPGERARVAVGAAAGPAAASCRLPAGRRSSPGR